MKKPTRFAAAISTVLLALTTACSQSEPSQNASVTPTPPKLTTSRPSSVGSKAASPTPSPTAQPEHFQDGLDAGISAATLTQSAQSKDDWNLVVSRWRSAIDLLKTVPKTSPNYPKAQQKITQYQRNLAYAQQQTNIPPKPKATANVTLPVPEKPSQNSPSTVAAPTAIPRQTNPSTVTSEVALAQHLKQIGAKLYGTYWCGYCRKQKALFGKEALSQINYIECDPAGENARPDLCRQANINSFPTWEIKGNQYGGLRSLWEIADLSGYHGDRHFTN